MPQQAKLLGGDSLNTINAFPSGQILGRFQERQFSLPSHNRIDKTFLQCLPWQKTGMPPAKNNGNPWGLLFDRLSHSNRPSNHGASEYGDSQAQGIAQFTKTCIQPIWFDCRVDDHDLEAGSEQRGRKAQ
jgi:hypothetical protein